MPLAMREAVLGWYATQGRRLAFRKSMDPYAILVAEAMAQQTQASRAAEAWQRFLDQFPSFAGLAAATPAAVLRAWRGLGYNRRALALRRAAIEVMARHGGALPRDLEALERLPGIGPYTARAVAALAFGQPVGAVDTNVRRVLVRTMVGDARAWSAAGDRGAGSPGPSGMALISPRDLQALADASVPPDRPGPWTHALMDIGAVVCRPRNPRCNDCPAMPWCRTAALRSLDSRRSPGSAVAIGDAVEDAEGFTAPGMPVGPAARSQPRVRRTREASVGFTSTSRWLRGRILDRLRDAPDGDWVTLAAPIGEHGVDAILTALTALDREGLAQRHPHQAGLARLPLD